MPCAVTPSGRVWGTAIGMPCTLTVRPTPKARTSWVVGLDHAGPLVVGLGADEEQEGHALLVDDAVEQQARVVVAAPVVAVEDHDGPASAVVEQLVDVEGGDDARLVGLEEVVGHQSLRVAGIDESAEGDDEHRGLQLLEHARRGVALELEELGRVLHGSGLSSSRIVSCNALLHVKIPTPPAPGALPGRDRGQARTLAIALSTRWGETLYAVPTVCAKSETRSSSIIQPMSTTSAAPRWVGRSVSSRSA